VAQHITNLKERSILLQMAQTWQRLAKKAEREHDAKNQK
jgi:hypothetical protein